MEKDDELAHYVYEGELQAIRNAKLNEIQRAWHDLFLIGIAPELYKKNPNYIDYETFEERLREQFEVKFGDRQTIINTIDSGIKELSDGGSFSIGIKGAGIDKSNQMEKLLSLDYVPPQDWIEVADHLLLLGTYYTSDFDYYNPIAELRFDISLCKILRVIGSLSVISSLNGKDLARIKKMAKTKSDEVELKKTYVKLIYHGEKIKETMNLHTVATIIRDEFIKKQEEGTIPEYFPTPKKNTGKSRRSSKKNDKKSFHPPKITMIKEYLFEDEKIRKDFKKKGKFWIIER